MRRNVVPRALRPDEAPGHTNGDRHGQRLHHHCRELPLYARVLADSFLEHHPDGAFTVLVIDDRPEPGTRDPRITWMRLADVGLDGDEIRRLAGIYNVTELSTAVKPLLLRRLLDDGAGEVIYLDPDIRVYGALSDIVDLARRHDVVLTPHTMRPFPADGREVDARFILSAGVYNLGFIAVGGAARPFLEWWWMSTRREALMDVARMMFTDQRVVDFVPALFTHHILKDPGCNVAYWNLHGAEPRPRRQRLRGRRCAAQVLSLQRVRHPPAVAVEQEPGCPAPDSAQRVPDAARALPGIRRPDRRGRCGHRLRSTIRLEHADVRDRRDHPHAPALLEGAARC